VDDKQNMKGAGRLEGQMWKAHVQLPEMWQLEIQVGNLISWAANRETCAKQPGTKHSHGMTNNAAEKEMGKYLQCWQAKYEQATTCEFYQRLTQARGGNILDNCALSSLPNQTELHRVHGWVKLVVSWVEVALHQAETTPIGNDAWSKHHTTHSFVPHQGCQLHSTENNNNNNKNAFQLMMS